MFEYIRTAALATALSFGALTGMAQASTVDPASDIVNLGTYDILAGPYFYGISFNLADTGGALSFTFTNSSATDATVGVTVGTVLQATLAFLGGVTATWTNGQTVTIGEGITAAFNISSVLAAGGSDTLTIVFGDTVNGGSRGRADIDLSVAAVPLPAGGLLLIGAIGGLAALRRRKAVAV